MADEYISKQKAKDLMGCCLASAKAQYKAEKNEFKKARYGDYISTIQAMIDVVGAVEVADDLISKDKVLKLIESFKVGSNQKLSKEDFERNVVLCMLEDEIKGITLEEACK